MNILHVWNTAFVPVTLTKYLRRLGHNSIVIHRVYDPIGQMLHAGINSSLDKELMGIIRIVERTSDLHHEVYTRLPETDIVHVHSAARLIPKLRQHYPKIPVVLTYHGSDIRMGGWKSGEVNWSRADKITVSTPDLLRNAPEGVEHIPNPVDVEMFTQLEPFIPNTMLYNHQKVWGYKALEWAYAAAKQMDVRLVLFERPEFTIPYITYPRFLEQYEFYLDLKIANAVWWHAESLTNFQARALWRTTIFNNKRKTGVPEEVKAELVVRRWESIYNQMLATV